MRVWSREGLIHRLKHLRRTPNRVHKGKKEQEGKELYVLTSGKFAFKRAEKMKAGVDGKHKEGQNTY